MPSKQQITGGWSPITFVGEVTNVTDVDDKGKPLTYQSGNPYTLVTIKDEESGQTEQFHSNLPVEVAEEVLPTGVRMIHRFHVVNGFLRHLTSTPA